MRMLLPILSLLFLVGCYDDFESMDACHWTDPACGDEDWDGDGVANKDDDFASDPSCHVRDDGNCSACGVACGTKQGCSSQGVCECPGNWSGEECTQCSGGWTGDECDICPPPWSGTDCNEKTLETSEDDELETSEGDEHEFEPDEDDEHETETEHDQPTDDDDDENVEVDDFIEEGELGLCFNTADLLVDKAPVMSHAEACTLCCFAEQDPGACSAACITGEVPANDCPEGDSGVTADCATCYATTVLCAIEKCVPACLAPDSEACVSCRSQNCDPAFYQCSGLESDCADGEDNNGAGAIDCLDPSCIFSESCQ
jgi:hypothetical protein